MKARRQSWPLASPQSFALRLWLTEEGKDRVARLKAGHIGERLAVLINSTVIAPPAVIVGPLPGLVDTVQLTPEIPLVIAIPLPQEEIQQLAKAVSQTWLAHATR